jgi:hypothetical protein
MATLFLLSAAVQYNDPDPLPWMAAYLGAAVVCLLPDSIRQRELFAWLVAAATAFSALRLAPGALALERLSDLTAAMSVARPEVEAARETLGLAFVSLWSAGAAIRHQWMRQAALTAATSG